MNTLIWFLIIESSIIALQRQILVGQFIEGEDFIGSGWTVGNSMTPEYSVTKCGSVSMFGGGNVFNQFSSITQNFVNLAPHYKATITYIFYLVNFATTENSGYQRLYIDGLTDPSQSDQTNKCQVDNKSYNIEQSSYNSTFLHDSQNLIIMISNPDSSVGFWGINNLTLSISTCASKCLTCTGPDSYHCRGFKILASSWLGLQVSQEGWQVKDGKQGVSNCAGVQMFGGFGLFGQKTLIQNTFVNLAIHTKLWFKLQFWAIDSWDGEPANILVDGAIIWTQNPNWMSNLGWPNYICLGTANWDDQLFDISIQIPHTGSTVTIVINSGLNQDSTDESWGVRDFQLFIDGFSTVNDYLRQHSTKEERLKEIIDYKHQRMILRNSKKPKPSRY